MRKKHWPVAAAIVLVAALFWYTTCIPLSPMHVQGALFWAALATALLGAYYSLVAPPLEFELPQPRELLARGAIWPQGGRRRLAVLCAPALFFVVLWLLSLVPGLSGGAAQAQVLDSLQFTGRFDAAGVYSLGSTDVHTRTARQWVGDAEQRGANGFEVQSAELYSLERQGRWLLPLRPTGAVKWFGGGASAPGYYALDGDGSSEFYESSIKYLPRSYLGSDALRCIRLSGHIMCDVGEFHFTLDDSGAPVWYAPRLENTAVFCRPSVTGVFTVDAHSGAVKLHELGALPGWVREVYPDKLLGTLAESAVRSTAVRELLSKGTLALGALSAEAYSGGERYVVRGVVPATSPQSMVGVLAVGARTGEILFTAAEWELGALGDRAAVLGQPGGQAALMWRGEGNRLTALMLTPPQAELSAESLAALEQSAQAQCAATPPAQGLQVDGGSVTTVISQIERIVCKERGGEEVYYFTLADAGSVYIAAHKISDELALTQQGDTVSISYGAGATRENIVTEFENLSFVGR